MSDNVEQPETDSAEQVPSLDAIAERLTANPAESEAAASELPQETVSEGETEPEGQPDPLREAEQRVIDLFGDDTKNTQFRISEDEVVDGEELQRGFLRQQDYTKKTQSLAEERRQADQKTNDYLNFAFNANQSALKQFEQVDWQRLQAENPAEYQALQQQFYKLQERDQHIHQAFDQFRAEQRQRYESDQKRRALETIELLKVEIPGWDNELYVAMGETAQSYGIDPNAFGSITDPAFFRMLHDAHRYRKAVKSTDEALKPKADPAPRSRPVATNQSQVDAMNRAKRMKSDDLKVRQQAGREQLNAIAAKLSRGKS